MNDNTEHPALTAARMIRDLHSASIAKIDEGFVFMRDGVDVSAEMREKSVVQVSLCEKIIERAKHMGNARRVEGQDILEELEAIMQEAKQNADGLAHIPEIGDYGHDA